jgi:putative NIF3 family GTP cyclohydrolase 1 type 2
VNYKIAEKIGLHNVRILEPKAGEEDAGSGVVGELKEAETETDFLKRIKKTFEVGCVKHNRLNGRLIRKVALCGGAGAFLLPKAVDEEADVFITGEVRYHDYFDYEDRILIAEIGHYESEQYTKEIFYSIIRELCPTLEMEMTRVNTNPIKYL